MKQACSLYIIEADYTLNPAMQCFKVGISNSVGSRLATLQTAAPFRLFLRQSVTLPTREIALLLEKRMHEALGRSALMGEWFCAYLTGALCDLDSIAANYWIEQGGDAESLPSWFEQIGLGADAAGDVILAEGLQ